MDRGERFSLFWELLFSSAVRVSVRMFANDFWTPSRKRFRASASKCVCGRPV
jgi:hypothetical protein